MRSLNRDLKDPKISKAADMKCAGALLVALAMLLCPDDASAGNEQQLKISGGNIRIEFESLASPSLRKLVIEWVTASARAISIYYQKFPVSDLRIGIRFFDGHGTRSGHANGWNGASITSSGERGCATRNLSKLQKLFARRFGSLRETADFPPTAFSMC
jgi:hypothetical protein